MQKPQVTPTPGRNNLPPVSPLGLASRTTSQLDTASLSSHPKAMSVGNMHVSQSHTNLLLMDATSDFSELVDFEQVVTPRRKLPKKPQLCLHIDPSLVALLSLSAGSPLDCVEFELQAIKAALDDCCSKYTSDWDKFLGDPAKSLFQSLGGWKSLILKIHQMFASILLSPSATESYQPRSNAWETTSLLAHIARMKINAKHVQVALSRIHELEAKIPVITIQLGPEKASNSDCLIDLQILWYSVQCCGRFDTFLEALIASQLTCPIFSPSIGSSREIANAIAQKGSDIYKSAQFRHRLFAEQYEWYMLMLSQQGSEEGLEATLKDIETDLLFSNFNPTDTAARKRIERLLVQMVGHPVESIRSTSVKMMNRFYDTHDWQAASPFVNIQTLTVGEILRIEWTIPESVDLKDFSALSLELVAPSMSPELHSMESFTRWMVSDLKENNLSFGELHRCGFYDWRITGLNTSQFSWEPLGVQGRFIVHPRNTRDLQICSALVDQVRTESGNRGSFSSVASEVIETACARVGFNAVRIQGAAARDNGQLTMGGDPTNPANVIDCERPNASPFAVTDRASPCEFLGGRNGFTELTSVARRNGVHTFVDVSCRVSATHKHRKYRDQHLYIVDKDGVKRLMDGDHSVGGTCLLNYRCVDAWDLLVSDIRAWPTEFGTSGVWLDNVTEWPPLLPIDKTELLRIDPDGELHYSSNEIMTGTVCREPVAGEKLPSYWTCAAYDEGWSNPLLVKIVREIWREFPGFHFMADLPGNDRRREIFTLIGSGIVPVLTSLTCEIAPMYGKNLDPITGKMKETETKSTSKPVNEFLAKNRIPPRGIVGMASTFASCPPIPRILGRGRAPFTDLLFALPTIPCVHYGEYECMMDQLGDFFSELITVDEKPSTPPLPIEHVMHTFAPLVVGEPQTTDVSGCDETQQFIELDPANCLAQFSLLSKLRRRKGGDIFTSNGEMQILPTSDPQTVCVVRSSRRRHVLVVMNFGSEDSMVNIDMSCAGFLNHSNNTFLIETDFIETTSSRMSIPWTVAELTQIVYQVLVPRFSSCFRSFKILSESPSKKFLTDLTVASLKRKGAYIHDLLESALNTPSCEPLHQLLTQLSGGGIDETKIFSHLVQIAGDSRIVPNLAAKISTLASGTVPHTIASNILAAASIGPIMFTTPELGKWSTFGGLGVMVDDLINTLSPIRESSNENPVVWVCSPYYERNRKGESGYLAKDNVNWSFNIDVDIGIERVTVGVYETIMNGIRYFFLHNGKYFPSIYPDFQPVTMTAFLTLMAKCPLEICCRIGQFPSTIVTNDWATGLTAAYAKNNFFGPVFSNTKFMHIVHNLDQNYEGRLFPPKHDDVAHVHMLPKDLLVDPHWQRFCVNPSRCAILSSDNWGTVSVSYRKELLEGSALSPILRMHSQPFAHPNGIPLEVRLDRINATGCKSHWEAKTAIQRKYFPNTEPSKSTVLIGFVGRITFQKGVHLILEIAEQLLRRHAGQVQVIVGGMMNPGEQYAIHCADRMRDLNRRFPNGFWSDPDAFFVDGSLLNFGADFGLMPSAFEPGGIVQQEFLVAGTPVIAFKTGGLKDTITEFYNGEGNGFTFEAHTAGDLAYAVERALRLFWNDRKGYERIRENSRTSVITCDMVAKAWLGEFYRMHDKVYFDSKQVRELMKNNTEWVGGEIEGISLGLQDLTDEEMSSSSEDWIGGDRSVTVSTPKVSAALMRRDPSIAGIVRRTVRISYKPALSVDVPRSVLLAGSFDQWASRIPLRWEKSTRSFFVDIRVPQGRWFIKLIVDGSWTCISDYPTEKDYDGNVNNVILVD